MGFTVKEVTEFRAATFMIEALLQMYILRNLQNIRHN